MTAMPTSTTPTTVRLTDRNQENIERYTKLTKRSRNYVINEMLDAQLEDRIAYLEELNEAVASIDTEPTYDAEDVFAWMKTWGTDEEKPLEQTSFFVKK